MLTSIIAYYCIWWSWWVQDIEPCILHLYTLDLSKEISPGAKESLWKHAGYHCLWLHADLFHLGQLHTNLFLAGSGHWAPLNAWNQLWDPLRPRTAQQSSGTCPAPISPQDRRKRCPSIPLVHLRCNNVKIELGFSQLLPIITYYWPPPKTQQQTQYLLKV